jgi:hypothetical protein
MYTHDYWVFFYELRNLLAHWLGVPGDLLFFSNNPLNAAFLTTLYVYWLMECWELLWAKPKKASWPV